MLMLSKHIGPLCFMALLILGSQAFRHYLQCERLRGEGRRLRSALTISLQALRKLYENNLGVFAGGRPPLISGRNQMNLLRLQLGRLLSLNEPEIEAVLAANIAAEAVETAMAIAGRKLGGVAYTVPAGREAREILELALTQACSMLESAENLMTLSAEPRATAVVDNESGLCLPPPVRRTGCATRIGRRRRPHKSTPRAKGFGVNVAPCAFTP